MRRFGDWSAQSLRYMQNFKEIDVEPTSSYFGAYSDSYNYWTGAKFEVKDEDKIDIYAERWFDQYGDERDWELGQLRKMVVSFSDRYNQMYQNSGLEGIDLILFSGHKTESMILQDKKD